MGDNRTEHCRVIADRQILTAFNSTFKAEEFTGKHIVAGERLFVYAHSLVDGATQRTQHAGLKKLQKLLAHPASECAAVTVLGMAPVSAYGRLGYLFAQNSPLRYCELPITLPLDDHRVATSAEWHELTRRASEEELEIQCSVFRHSLQSVMGATRIFLGAAIAGHVDAGSPEFEQTLSSLQLLVQQAGGPVSLSVQELVDSCKSHQQRFSKDYPGIYKPTEIDLWVLDDHWPDHGWKLVFESLPFRSVRGFTRWEELESLISNGHSRPTTLMVDCNLGPGVDTPTGLELLRSIRSRWQDVRVVFSTAYDDASLALTSLREGANAFFAKELNDKGDRRSLDYYRQFTSLLRPHPIEARVSSLWQTFSSKDTRTNSSTSDPDLQPPATLDIMLRLAFFLLFSLIDDKNHWNGNKLAVSEEHLFRAVVNLVGAGYPKLRNPKTKLGKSKQKTLKKAAHGGEIDFEEVFFVLDGVFRILQETTQTSATEPWKQNQQTAFWPYEVEDLKTDSSYPGVMAGAEVMQHDTADGQGAIELMRGICGDVQCEQNHGALSVHDIAQAHPVSSHAGLYSGLILVDNAGTETEWFNAFQLIFPNSKVFTNVMETLEHARSKKARVNLIVLDLKLPSFEAGYQALDRILAWDPSVPVVTTSASWHALEAIRSLRKGAIDFISKTIPCSRDLPACVQFANEYKRKCDLLVQYGKSDCRDRWGLLHALRHNTKRDPLKLGEANRKVEICNEHKSKQAQPDDWQVPPDPLEWNSLVADELALLLRLRQHIFFTKDQNLILPIDNWRWEYVLQSKSEVAITKLVAILAGNIIERLAMWQWCLRNEQALESRRWGIPEAYPRGDEIEITDEINKLGALGASTAWYHRNAVLHPEGNTQPLWNAKLCDDLIKWGFKVVTVFGRGTMYN